MEFTTVWAGERGSYLCAGPSLSSEPRLAMEADAEPREGRGYRPIGGRFRDTVYAVTSRRRMAMADICTKLESTGQLDMVLIARALATLVKEGKLQRERAKVGPVTRWIYWRP